MAVEKAALELPGACLMEQRRKGLTEAVDELEKCMKAETKRAVRQRIRRAAEKLEFAKIVLPAPSKP